MITLLAPGTIINYIAVTGGRDRRDYKGLSYIKVNCLSLVRKKGEG
jgi:hypothetical protein